MEIADLITDAWRSSLPPGYLPADNPAFDDALYGDALDAAVADFLEHEGGHEVLALIAVARLIGGADAELVVERLLEALGCLCSPEVYEEALDYEPTPGVAIAVLAGLLKGCGK